MYGKTTLLDALSSFVPDGERFITIEDAAEFPRCQTLRGLAQGPANVEGRGEVTVRALVRNARMRPDRIIVGGRGGEALDMLQAMNTRARGR